ncbi:MAG: UxaA family hydrolase [Sedimentisphaerales bacterium]|nr:UxaA family hydrolase [Sedimentisphaerales bacterium]
MEDQVNPSSLSESVIVLNEKDNVCVALKDILPGKYVLVHKGTEILLNIVQRINAGFKISLTPIKCGSSIYKYGHKIGTACKDIKSGEQVHVDNMRGLTDMRRGGSNNQCV